MDKLKRDRARQRGKDSLGLIEEAIYLLRSAPSSHLAWYFAGTVPFVLAALYFWGDMSRNPFAGQRLVGESLVLSCLFLWMKTCQAIFSWQMRCLVSGEHFGLSSGRFCRVLLSQASIQPSGLFLLPMALVLAFPFPWMFAFYQNISVLDDGETLDLRGLIRKASGQALVWPGQNHSMLGIVGAFAFFICLNLMTGCFILPGLAKMLFGFETVFTRSGLSLINTTFFAAVLGLTYICIDPIVKTLYALRCFYGESRRTGADLKSELRRIAIRSAASVLMIFLAFGFTFLSFNAWAGEQISAGRAMTDASLQQTKPPSSVSTSELDRTIQEIIRQPKYAWREPRNKQIEVDDSQKGFFARLFERFKPFLINSMKAIGRWLDGLLRRLFFRQQSVGTNDIAGRWIVFLHLLLYALIAATLVGLIWLFYRILKNRRHKSVTILSEALQPAPDLLDENLGADQLPEDSWMRLARELLAKGELRLALRSFYLASLAHLAAKNLVHLARFKSNRDYERELRRRAHAFPDLIVAFGENLLVFDQIWYGMHEISQEMINRFTENVERVRSNETPVPPPQGMG